MMLGFVPKERLSEGELAMQDVDEPIPDGWAIVPGQNITQVPGMITLVYVEKVE